MTLIRPSLDYTAKDFDALSARLFNVIPSAFPEWTDVQIANYGNLLVEMFAFVGDVLTYYQDNQAQESRWSTAMLRRSMLSMIKMIPYKAKGASPARVVLTVQLAAPPVGTVTIEAGDKFSTLEAAEPVVFQAISTTVIAAGANPAVAFVEVENSKLYTEPYMSTGLPRQQFLLNESPYIDGSISILADDGQYVVVDDLFGSTATDRHATVAVDENSRVNVAFGNGIAGSIPVGTISFVYKTGGGSAANVGKATIKRALRNYTDSLGNSVSLKVTNAARASGGADVQTAESIREDVPRSLRALTRTVCREDYEINALLVPGVARALMLAKDEKPTILENRGNLYIVPEGGGVATQGLLAAVLTQITTKLPKTITFKPTVMPAVYLTVDVSTRIHLAAGAIPSVVGAAVKKAVIDFFAPRAADGSRNNLIDFGYYLDGSIAWSDVFNAVRDTRGVRKVDDGLGNLVLNGESDDLTVPPEMFPILGTVTVINAATGAAL